MSSLEISSLTFSGLSHRTGPMTWPQRAIWDVVCWEGKDAYRRNIWTVWKLPNGIHENDVTEAFEILVAEWEALRTTYEAGDGWPRQVVHGSGEILVHLHRASPERIDDCAEKAVRKAACLPFNSTFDMPLRIGIVSVHGEAVRAIAVFSHMAVDGWSMNLVRRMFEEVLLDGKEALAPYAGKAEQPLERVKFEHSDAAALAQRRTLGFWQQAFRETPAVMFSGGPEEACRIERARLHSHDMARAVRVIRGSVRGSNAAVLLGAAALVLSAALDVREVVIRMLVTTRFRQSARYSIAALNLNGLFRLQVDSESASSYFGRATIAALLAIKYSECNPATLDDELVAITRARGVPLAQWLFFNDLSQIVNPGPPYPERADHDECCDGVVVCKKMMEDRPERESKFLLTVLPGDEVSDLHLYLDRRFIPLPATEMLMSIERILSEAAEDLSIDTDVLVRHCRERLG